MPPPPYTGRFTEDGSFIGQYGAQKRKGSPPTSSGAALPPRAGQPAPPEAGSTVWGGEPVACSPPPPARRLPSGLVCTRELLVAAPLAEERRLACALRLRWRADSPAGHRPPLVRVQARVRARPAAELAVGGGDSDEPPRRHRQSRASSAGADIRELDKFLIYLLRTCCCQPALLWCRPARWPADPSELSVGCVMRVTGAPAGPV